ncbi:hypothetical protein [Micromonospora sp. CB01531]|uniref:hypothetical protein n=1 Tax=Micromonospora sp. CB01531 TaxID=1718947 RepID=UPI00093DD311|nr:hypothetical protein [Micromonospora sp. CB01531]OKI84554.1 hypothetical protein A6A27_40385 [Micromonospora sp. CB01531]
MSQAAAIIVGAAISGIIGVLVVVTQQWLTHHHDKQNARVGRLCDFMAAGWALSLALGRLAHAPGEQKAKTQEHERLSELLDRFNACMAQVQLLESGDLYIAAHRLDRALAELVGAARDHQYSTTDWRLRRAAATEAVEAFHRAARRVIRSGDIPPDVVLPARQARPQEGTR